MQEFDGSCYIGVVGSDMIPTLAATSIVSIEKRDGDSGPHFITATKGYAARQEHFNKFLDSEHAFMLLLDHDMIFDPDTLERLRSHGAPYVSGYYLRRQFAPMYSVWYRPFDGHWPMEPFLDEPERGRLHELGASGWGCVLIHRHVIEDTRGVLKGELDVIEDDMDVWPYDLAAVRRGDEQMRPLRGIKDQIVGSDIRYPFYAKAAGWTLQGDPDVRPKHILSYPLSPDDFGGQTLAHNAQLKANHRAVIDEHREKVRQVLSEVGA